MLLDEKEKQADDVERSILGYVEAVDESGIYGWAYDRANLLEAAILSFFVDGEWVSEAECRVTRQDVQDAGHPRADVGFHVIIPPALCDGLQHHFSFKSLDGRNIDFSRTDQYQPGAKDVFCFRTHFDNDFYIAEYPDAATLGPQGACLQWRADDKGLCRFPNSVELIANLEQELGSLPEGFSPLLYRFLNPDIAQGISEDWQATCHFLRNGRATGRRFDFGDQSFIVDLYFDGIKPLDEVLTRFIETNSSRLYASLDALLSRNGITSNTFISHLSIPDYIANTPELTSRTRLSCIRHFAETGLAACKPLSFDSAFDHSFVCEIENAYRGLSEQQAYLRWINVGVDAGTTPNPDRFLTELGLSDVSKFPPAFDAEIYLSCNPELRETLPTRWSALKHVVERGLAEGRLGCPVGRGTLDIYRAAADRLAISGQLKAARKLYEAIVSDTPDDSVGLRHYGDCLLREGEFYFAARVYESTIDLGRDNVWTHLNLVTCHMRLKGWSQACSAIHRVCKLRPGDRALQRRFRDVLAEAYREISADAHWLATNKFYEKARSRIGEACALLKLPLADTLSEPARLGDQVRSVTLVADLGLPQCKFYRVDQKMEQLKSIGIDCKLIDYRSDIFRSVRESAWTDLVILYRVPATPDIMWAVGLFRKASIPIFYEIDDLMFDPALFPDTFESYGGQISHDLYATLITGSISLQAVMEVSDYAIASTQALADRMAPFVVSKQAFVHRNGLSGLHQRSVSVSPPTKRPVVRLFYGSGTKAHNDDFDELLAEPLARLLKKHGATVQVFLLGYLKLPRVLKPYLGQITVSEPIWNITSYWNVLREMDISLAVLKPGLVADCKSEIKWLEAAMLSVPSVVSDTLTYRDAIEDNRTGVVVSSPDEWFNALDRLVAEAPRRWKMGKAAQGVALRTYSGEALSRNLQQIFQAISRPPGKEAIRVLVVNVFYPPQAIGGATRVVADNISDIRAHHGNEFAIEVFTTLEGGAEAYVPLVYVEKGVRVTAIPTPLDAGIDRKIWDERMGEFFERTVDRFRPDLVHFHCIQRITLSACQVLRNKKIPYVVTVHDGWWISDDQFLLDEYANSSMYDFEDPLNEMRRCGPEKLERMKAKQSHLAAAAQVLAVSEPFAEVYRSCGFKNVVTVANGVSDFKVLPRVPSPDGRVRMAHVGGASFHKGYHLVRAALTSGDFDILQLLVVDHAMDPDARRYTMWGKTEVIFRGKVPQSQVGELYRDVDVLLAPSVWPESYGLVAREAALAGCWIVASDRGAVGIDVTPDNGDVVNVSSQDDLREVLARLSRTTDKLLITSASKPARFSRQQADEIVELYRLLQLSTSRRLSLLNNAERAASVAN